MNPSYKLLIHITIREKIEELIKRNPQKQSSQIEKQITTTFKKILSEPYHSGSKCLKDIPEKSLVGKLRRVYIGGNQGYRLFYFLSSSPKYIIPIFISTVPRRNLDYNKLNWDEILEIDKDYKKKNYNRFIEYSP